MPPPSQGLTALHITAAHRHMHIISVLLAAGTLPTLPDPRGTLPIHIAVSGGHPAAARLLQAAPATATAVGMLGLTPLLVAAQRGQEEMVRNGAGRHTWPYILRIQCCGVACSHTYPALSVHLSAAMTGCRLGPVRICRWACSLKQRLMLHSLAPQPARLLCGWLAPWAIQRSRGSCLQLRHRQPPCWQAFQLRRCMRPWSKGTWTLSNSFCRSSL